MNELADSVQSTQVLAPLCRMQCTTWTLMSRENGMQLSESGGPWGGEQAYSECSLPGTAITPVADAITLLDRVACHGLLHAPF